MILLDARFEGQASEHGLEGFLGSAEGDHWILLVPLESGILRFGQQRVRASELALLPLNGTHLLVVENESSLHQLPRLAGTTAVMGCGLDLEWMRAEWLGQMHVGYWGDLDTWGLQLLARARLHQPHVRALLMSSEIFDFYCGSYAVSEPVRASNSPPATLTAEEQALYTRLYGLTRSRLEQEFLPASLVECSLSKWRAESSNA